MDLPAHWNLHERPSESRELNRLGKLALEFAWVRDPRQVPASAVDAGMRDLERQQTL